MASIASYPGGRFRAVVRRVGFKTVSDIFPTKKQAEAWARSVETDMHTRRHRDPTACQNDTVGSIFERYRDEVCPGRKGGHWEVVRINKFLKEAEFMLLQVKQLQPADIRTWRDERCKKINPRSVNREMNLLSAVFSHAIDEWDFSFPGGAHPIKAVSRPKKASPVLRHRRWEDHEIQAFLKAAGHDAAVDPKVGLDYVPWAFLLALETAMRPSEICAVKVADVRLSAKCITLHDSKNGSGRRVPLSTAAVGVLEVLVRGKKSEDPIVPITAQTLGDYYRRLRRKAGLQNADLRFYDVKHESISRLSTKFANVLELAAVTGHKSLQSLRYYYNPKVEELAAKLG